MFRAAVAVVKKDRLIFNCCSVPRDGTGLYSRPVFHEIHERNWEWNAEIDHDAMKYATTRVGEPSQMRLTFECRNSVPQLDLYFLRWHKCSVCHIELERLSNYIRKVYFVVLARCVPSDSGNQARRQKKALGSSPILSAFTISLAPRVCCFLLFSDPRVRKTRNEVKGKERSLEWSRYKFNFPAQICANTNPHALCCLKQDWSKLYSLREIFFNLFS